MLEGGYDLDALRDSTTACLSALLGETVRPEPSTRGGTDAADHMVTTVRDHWLKSELLTV